MNVPRDYDDFMVQVHQALNLPIRPRCAQLTVLMDRGSLLQLHNLFPVLVTSIFGLQGQPGWGLRSITQGLSAEFDQVNFFLSTRGPLFNLIYILLRNENIKFEYPAIYLPSHIQQLLGAQSGYQFYAELVNCNPQIRRATSLLLNPFDYYIFYFAYHLIDPWQQRFTAMGIFWNTLYYTLCCEYIVYFLPSNPGVIYPEIAYNGKNPNKQVVPSSNLSSTSANFIDDSGLHSPNRMNASNNSSRNSYNFHPRNDIWRSESVLTVFSDMWMYNDSIVRASSKKFHISSFNRMNLPHFNELPTGEYVRIIRVLIKQVHRFSDSASIDDTYLSELKKVSIPMIQGKFYIFLRNLVHKWPLDASFRVVLELWLTYIQPWRYLATNVDKFRLQQEYAQEIEEITLEAQKRQSYLSSNHKQFIAENLLCYVVIFEQIVPRFFRVDLDSPKMALMLYRLTKVFDQPNLPDYIKEIEQCVENRQPSPSPKKNSGWSTYSTTPTANWSTRLKKHSTPNAYVEQHVSFFIDNNPIQSENKWLTITMQKIFELEGPNFYYRPLFTQPPPKEILTLLKQIQQAIISANDYVRHREEQEKIMYSGFWGLIKYFGHTSDDEFTMEERRKVPIYLEVAFINLKQMFEVTNISLQDPSDSSNSGNTFEKINEFRFLTPESVHNRLKTLKYDGDPDLEPIRSYECTFLVRHLYQIAVKINDHFRQTFYQLYHKPNYMGRFYRRFLLPPITIHSYDKTVLGSPRVGVPLPPRISLRSCASYRFLFYFISGAVLAWAFGFNMFSYVLTLFVIFLLYNMLRAIPADENPSIRHSYPTQGFGNISFNDSF